MKSCFQCKYSSDKCKNQKCSQYNKYLEDISKCDLFGRVDNSPITQYKLNSEY